MRSAIAVVVSGLVMTLAGCSGGVKLAHAPGSGNAVWPYHRGTIDGSGSIAAEQFQGKLGIVWRTRLGDKPAGPLTIYESTLVYPGSRKRLRFIDLFNGRQLGAVRLKGVAQTGAVFVDGVALVGLGAPRHEFQAVNVARGKVRWRAPFREPVAGSILSQGTVIASSAPGVVRAFQIETGEEVWSVTLKDRCSAPPVLADSLVLQPTDAGSLVALHVADGHEVYRVKLPAPILASASGDAILTDFSGGVHRYEANTAIWSAQVDGRLWSSPLLTGSTVIVGNGNGIVTALDKQSGLTTWTFAMREVVRCSPIVVGPYVLVGGLGGRLVCLNAADGTLVDEMTLEGPIAWSPVSDGNRIYVATQTGHLYCLGAPYVGTITTTD